MKILIVTAEYPPEPMVSGRMAFDLAQYLASVGHTLTVLAPFPSRPIATRYPEFHSRFKARVNTENGVNEIRLVSFTHPESSILGRARESWSFGRAAATWLRQYGCEVELIYDMSWPMFGQHCVSRVASELKIPLVMSIMDVYPECLLKRLPRWVSWLARAPLISWDRAIVHRAESIVVISQEMRVFYQRTRGLPQGRLNVVPTWQDESIFFPRPNRAESARKYGIDDRIFTFMFLGNIGVVAEVEHLIRSFQEADIPNAQLVISGDGSQKALCVELANRLNCGNIHFLADPDATKVPVLQSIADIFLLPMKRGAAGSSTPSKLGAYMFSGKAIIATVDPESATARAIIDAQCGWVGPPGDVAWLAGQMQKVFKMPARELTGLGQRALAYGLANITKNSGVRKLHQILCRAARPDSCAQILKAGTQSSPV